MSCAELYKIMWKPSNCVIVWSLLPLVIKQEANNDQKLREHLDNIILRWTHRMASNDLTILGPDFTSDESCACLLVNDWETYSKITKILVAYSLNKNSPTASAYYKRLRTRSAQLPNIGSMSQIHIRCFNLLRGLTEAHQGDDTSIQQNNSLPSFHKVRLMLTKSSADGAAMISASPISKKYSSHQDNGNHQGGASNKCSNRQARENSCCRDSSQHQYPENYWPGLPPWGAWMPQHLHHVS